MKLNLIKDFQEIVYLKLKKDFLDYLGKEIRKRKVKLNIKRVTRVKGFIKFTVLINLLKVIKIPFQVIVKEIEEIKFSPSSAPFKFKTKEPNISINFDNFLGGKVVAAFLADGYISTNGCVGYVNKNPELRRGFQECLKELFHNIELPEPIGLHQKKDLQLPSIFRPILNKVGVPTGKKVLINPKVPEWILGSNNLDTLRGYVQQFFDDEGHVSVEKRMIDLPQSVDVSKGRVVPNQLLGLRYLLEKFNIKTNELYLIRKYLVQNWDKTYPREKWVLTISNTRELRKFNEKIKFVSSKKQKRLEKILSISTMPQRKNHEIEAEAFQICKLIQNKFGYINSKFLSRKMNTGLTYAQQILRRLYQKRRLERIKERKYIHDSNHHYLAKVYNEYKLKEKIC